MQRLLSFFSSNEPSPPPTYAQQLNNMGITRQLLPENYHSIYDSNSLDAVSRAIAIEFTRYLTLLTELHSLSQSLNDQPDEVALNVITQKIEAIQAHLQPLILIRRSIRQPSLQTLEFYSSLPLRRPISGPSVVSSSSSDNSMPTVSSTPAPTKRSNIELLEEIGFETATPNLFNDPIMPFIMDQPIIITTTVNKDVFDLAVAKKCCLDENENKFKNPLTNIVVEFKYTPHTKLNNQIDNYMRLTLEIDRLLKILQKNSLPIENIATIKNNLILTLSEYIELVKTAIEAFSGHATDRQKEEKAILTGPRSILNLLSAAKLTMSVEKYRELSTLFLKKLTDAELELERVNEYCQQLRRRDSLISAPGILFQQSPFPATAKRTSQDTTPSPAFNPHSPDID